MLRILIFLFYYGQTPTLETYYKMQNNHFLVDFHKWPITSSWGSVAIFQCGYLFVWLQYLISKEEFLFLNFLKGFRWSLVQRSHFLVFIHFVSRSKLSKNPLPTSFGPLLWWSSTKLSQGFSQFIRPNDFKTPSGDYAGDYDNWQVFGKNESRNN